jgi:hypothetical protein
MGTSAVRLGNGPLPIMTILYEGLFVPAAPGCGVLVDPVHGGLPPEIALGLLAFNPAVLGNLFTLKGEHVFLPLLAPFAGAAGKPVRLGGFPTSGC